MLLFLDMMLLFESSGCAKPQIFPFKSDSATTDKVDCFTSCVCCNKVRHEDTQSQRQSALESQETKKELKKKKKNIRLEHRKEKMLQRATSNVSDKTKSNKPKVGGDTLKIIYNRMSSVSLFYR